MAMRFVLFHSPFVGPSSWRPVAQALVSAGHNVRVPDLRAACLTGEPETVIRAAVAQTGEEPAVIVGHSGAGFFLPLIADRLEPSPRGVVFVDAGIPPSEGTATAGGDFLDRLRSLAVDGVLPRWSTWWGQGVMEALVPDERRRAGIEAEMAEIPLALYDSPVTIPNRWCQAACAFLLLSAAYRDDADRARSLDWPVRQRVGHHLAIVNDPRAIAADIVELVRCHPTARQPVNTDKRYRAPKRPRTRHRQRWILRMCASGDSCCVITLNPSVLRVGRGVPGTVENAAGTRSGCSAGVERVGRQRPILCCGR